MYFMDRKMRHLLVFDNVETDIFILRKVRDVLVSVLVWFFIL